MDNSTIRKYLIKGLIWCLIASAAIAIISILVGSLTDIASRALMTVFVAAIHATIFLVFLPAAPRTFSASELGRKQAMGHNLWVDSVLFLVTADFLTATLGIWDIISTDAVVKFISVYFLVFVGVIAAKAVYNTEIVTQKLHTYAVVTYALIGAYVFLQAMAIFAPSLTDLANGLYGRLLVALFVSIATLLCIIAVMRRLHAQTHPVAAASATASPQKSTNVGLIIILSLVALFLVPFVMRILTAYFFRYGGFSY